MSNESGLRVELPDAHRKFRGAARAWLAGNLPRNGLPDAETESGFSAHRRWERTLADAGYAGISWPLAYGGAGGDLLQEALFAELDEQADGPKRITRPALRFIGPTIMKFGTDTQQKRWLRRMLRADDVWSQGFSEPGAGSDLAAVSTRAERRGDAYVVNGQKTWNTYGQFSDWLFALVRTGASGGRHHGLTCLAIDMRSPGIEVRPIRQVHGRFGFAEVFFTDVQVPASNLIGTHDDGWAVAMELLSFERGADTGGPARTHRRLYALAGDIADRLPHEHWDTVARELGSVYASSVAYRAFTYEQLTRQWQGDSTGYSSSLVKLYSSGLDTKLVDLGVDIFGDERLIEGSADYVDFWHTRAGRIYGGSAEIQRNIVADRILGLPR